MGPFLAQLKRIHNHSLLLYCTRKKENVVTQEVFSDILIELFIWPGHSGTVMSFHILYVHVRFAAALEFGTLQYLSFVVPKYFERVRFPSKMYQRKEVPV
jgi:hypothetical protein